MSASAEVYLSVSRPYDTDTLVGLIDERLNDVGFSGATAQTFISGHIWEARGWSVGWNVFEQDWADDFVRAIMAIAPECDVELYVYNLEREADNTSTTRRVQDGRIKGDISVEVIDRNDCAHCFNPSFSCACSKEEAK